MATISATENSNELKKSPSDSLQDKANKSDESTIAVKHQLTDYGSQVQNYLNKVDAKIDGFKFSIEKHKEGLIVDFSFRATIHPKDAKTTEKVV